MRVKSPNAFDMEGAVSAIERRSLFADERIKNVRESCFRRVDVLESWHSHRVVEGGRRVVGGRFEWRRSEDGEGEGEEGGKVGLEDTGGDFRRRSKVD